MSIATDGGSGKAIVAAASSSLFMVGSVSDVMVVVSLVPFFVVLLGAHGTRFLIK